MNVYLTTVSCLACADWTTSHCADVLHACGPHKVCTRLVLRPVQAEVRRTFVSSLDDVVDVVNTSADVNVAQLVGTQSGEPVYNWASYLGVHFRSIPHLKQYQHFIFSATHPGVVTLKEHSNSSGETFTMLDSGSWSPVASEFPPLIKSSGLPLERQWYLHKPYCREGTEDLTCPKPSLSLDTTTNTTTNKTGGAPAPPAKRRKCGKCGEIGHTRRSCKED